MVAFVRALTVTAVSVVPAAIAAYSISSSSPSSSKFASRENLRFSPSFRSIIASKSLRGSNFFFSAVQMDSPVTQSTASDENGVLPELLTEFMVDMHCDGCVSAVKNKLNTLNGIKGVEVDLTNQVVRVRGSLPVITMLEALEQTGRTARLIGQGNPNDFLISAAVAEFKGPVIFGVVRFAQVNMELARIEATFSGLTPGKHSWSINEFGDLTRGANSTGRVLNAPLGDLGTLEVGGTGDVQFSAAKEKIRVADLIGRSVVLYESEDKNEGIGAAVIARSAGVGENYKKLCTCDGVTIWESS